LTIPIDELLKRSRDGDRAALSELLDRFGPIARRELDGVIPRKWQSVLSMDDLMQQTYTAAFMGIKSFVPQGEHSFLAWLKTLAQHMLYDALRMMEAEKRGGHRRKVHLGTDEDSYVALYDAVSTSYSTPSRLMARSEARHALEQALEALPEPHRRLVRMYDLEGRPGEEVAAALDRSLGAMYMLRARAHRRLAEILGSSSNYLSRST
jgi:RNA polymerase sigma-70 factor (ECF subfamily)